MFFMLAKQAAEQKPSVLGELFGKIFNWLFNVVYGISPTWSLFITIVLFTIFVKLILLPLAIKQQKSLKANQIMQPKIKALQDKYKNKNDAESQQKMALEMQALYKENNSNPFVGCLLTFIQLPIIYALFDVMKHITKYITHIGDIYTNLANSIMAVPDSGTILGNLATAKKMAGLDCTIIDNVKNLFMQLSNADWTALLGDIQSHLDLNMIQGLIDQKNQVESFCGINLIASPSIRSISIILPLITAAVTYWSMNQSSNQTEGMDEQSKQMMKNMSSFMKVLIVTIFISSLSLPAAISIYWTLSNLWQMGQNWLLKKLLKDYDPTQDGKKKKDYIDVKDMKDVK